MVMKKKVGVNIRTRFSAPAQLIFLFSCDFALIKLKTLNKTILTTCTKFTQTKFKRRNIYVRFKSKTILFER